jgi:hypothetical protein
MRGLSNDFNAESSIFETGGMRMKWVGPEMIRHPTRGKLIVEFICNRIQE